MFLPPIGGITVYLFGDIARLSDPRTKITCRVHDECNGSDVFGSDICTCRPYLIHGIEECARAAQQGELGIIIYNRKEGRALGEVTKFLVYNARKRQEGGDAAATYFERTECVAGVQDARFQQLMPDALHWLGVRRIDRFVSMSDMKHDALVSQGIEIVERVPIPDELVPPDAHVEIAAKKAAGYYTPQPPKPEDLKHIRPAAREVLIVLDRSAAAKSLLSAAAVRERAHRLLALGDRLPNFKVNLDRLGDAAKLVHRHHAQGLSVTRRAVSFALASFRGRWRGPLGCVIDRQTKWPSAAARGRAAFDLAIVSVLLDAGAGPAWRYNDADKRPADRPLRRFGDCQSRDVSAPVRSRRIPPIRCARTPSVLAQLSEQALLDGFQVSAENPLVGVAGRCALLQRLGRTAIAAPSAYSPAKTRRAPAASSIIWRRWRAVTASQLPRSSLNC